MSEMSLESLAKRVEALEKKLSEHQAAAAVPAKDWRSVVGMFDGSEAMKQVIAEGHAIREAEREAARRGDVE